MNELLVNADKSDFMFVGTSTQLRAAKHVTNIIVTGTNLHPTDDLESLGFIMNSRLQLCEECSVTTFGHIRHLP